MNTEAKKVEAPTKRVLHVGCGDKERGSGLHKSFKTPEWQEVRLDIEASVKPDIVASITDMKDVADNEFDALYSSHNIEHLYAHDAIKALGEFYRVLKPGGHVLIATPDMQKVAEMAYKKGLETPLYTSRSGPVSPVDVFWGFRPSLAAGALSMAHKTGFTAASMVQKLEKAGFLEITVTRETYNLWAHAFKRPNADKSKIRKNRIIEEDINEQMRKRDQMDKEPELWIGYPPKR